MRGCYLCCFAGLLLAPDAVAGPVYHVTVLGNLGGSTIVPVAVNSRGQVSGTATNVFGELRSFLFDGIRIEDLGAAGPVQFAGGSLLWTNATNSAGVVAGAVSTPSGGVHAAVVSSGEMRDLGALPGGSWSAAYAINDAGQVVGYGDIAPGVFRAFSWSDAAGLVTVGTFGGASSYAMALNHGGAFAGHAANQSGYLNAFVYDSSGMRNLGTLGGGNSYAYGINSRGEVVGYSQTAGTAVFHAFLHRGAEMLDLNSLVSPGYGLELIAAYGINDLGQITGTALENGRQVAFLLDPLLEEIPVIDNPEPGGMPLAVTGITIIMLGLTNRKRKSTHSR